MHNPIKNESDLMVFLELMMESTHQIIVEHNPQEMEVYLNRWNYISEYAAENPNMQISILIKEVSRDFNKSIENVQNLYEMVSKEKYVAPQDRKTPPEEFSISNFLQRVSAQRENHAASLNNSNSVPPKDTPQ